MDKDKNPVRNVAEYTNFTPPTNFDDKQFEHYLIDIWENRKSNSLLIYDWEDYDDELIDSKDDEKDKEENKYQPFFDIKRDKLRAKNYIGSIQFNNVKINIFPKIFKTELERYLKLKEENEIIADEIKTNIYNNIIYWFSKCSRFRFPFPKSDIDKNPFEDFLQIYIYIFSVLTLQTIKTCPYYQYSEITEESDFLRGKLEMSGYITNLYRKREHKFVVTYEPFNYNNLLNKIIKYTAKLLLRFAKNELSSSNLNEILFILDEVSDVTVVSSDCDKIKLNSFQEDYEIILSLCKMFLSSEIVNAYNSTETNYCFFIPMEYVFEDFIASFIKDRFGKDYEIKTQYKYQKLAYSEESLFQSDEKEDVFKIRPDILLENEKISIVFDTKYKIRNTSGKEKPEEGISNTDVYQMMCYALRRNTPYLCLLYPSDKEIKEIGDNKYEFKDINESTFWITSKFFDNIKFIILKAFDLPIKINNKNYDKKNNDIYNEIYNTLESIFKNQIINNKNFIEEANKSY